MLPRPPKVLIRLMGYVHRPLYRMSGGRLFGRVADAKVLLLTTTGRRSGAPRTAPLLFVEDDGAYIVMASQGGHDTDPAWVLNLRATPEATVEIGTRRQRVCARELDTTARDRLWPKLVAAYPAWTTYRTRTTRAFPVFALTPVERAS